MLGLVREIGESPPKDAASTQKIPWEFRLRATKI
jgi:hypothetical protein